MSVRKRIKVIRAVRARDAARTETDGQGQQPALQSSAGSRKPAGPSAPQAPWSGYAALSVRIGLGLLLIVAVVFAANEAMVFLLK